MFPPEGDPAPMRQSQPWGGGGGGGLSHDDQHIARGRHMSQVAHISHFRPRATYLDRRGRCGAMEL